ncbi:MAG: hypothetical protein U0796_17900 [Gemmatales bacterium]
MYSFRQATSADVASIAGIAHGFFGSGYWHDGIVGRREYLAGLHAGNSATFSVLLHDEEIVGYSSVVACLPTIGWSHFTGGFCQYDYRPELMFNDGDAMEFTEDERIKGYDLHGLPIYAQALAVSEGHRKLPEAKKLRDEMLISNIVRVLSRYQGKDYMLFGEEFSDNGRKYMMDRGFTKGPHLSKLNHQIYALCRFPGSDFTKRIDELRE